MDKRNQEHKFGSTTLGNWDDHEVRKGGLKQQEKPPVEASGSFRRDDTVVYEDVWEALYQNKDVHTGEVEVNVSEGTVTLRGVIDTRLGRRLAASTIQALPGVLEVKNELWIRQPNGLISPEEDDQIEFQLPRGLVNNQTGLS